MKQFVILFASLLMSVSAYSARPPITSLNDLPSKWEGVAGDLFVRNAGSLQVNRILEVERHDGKNEFSATYTVDALVRFGAREILVSKIFLSSSSFVKDVYWMTIELKDELIPRLVTTLVYDEASNTYIMKDITQSNGEKRFIFTAKATQ